ncbi:Dabb family protein [Alteromonas lipolytica]|uniref:Stress-response A/B barrel domain-containing protein n=1 Tax=Alteromonas lipolytica TaxID=1856405 RepID=A0A1E8FIH5_9ALTE|nr:Dabb family protein [Alteromonas lipolytica]OFI35742.1 hypothetical protein BFC17_10675 [Alteromonas lipolytica]GGF80407.1 stress responsive protein [Alteromonas lipolytica]
MKNWRVTALLGLLFWASLSLAGEPTANEPVRHIVVFKYKTGSTEQQIQQVTNAFRALKDKIPGILSFEYGVNNSPEGLDQGFSHIYQLTFVDAAARDSYLPHPKHTEFGELLAELGILESVFVVDYAINP